jgi:hypothetical protein
LEPWRSRAGERRPDLIAQTFFESLKKF